MLNFLRPAVAKVLNPLGQALARTPITPNMITVAGTVGLSACALSLFPIGELFPGAFGCTVFVLTDMLDGTLARIKGTSSLWGQFLDSTMDRVADAAIFGGLTIWFMRTHDLTMAIVTMFCLACGLLVSYVKARAEGVGLNANVGLIERPERMLISLTSVGVFGLGVPYIMSIGLWALAAGSLYTLWQRMRAVWRDAKGKAAEPAPDTRKAGVLAVLTDRLKAVAFTVGWALVCRLPESWARALFTAGADLAWRRQGAGVRTLEGNLTRVLRTDGSDSVDGAELRSLSRKVLRSYARYYLETFRLQKIPRDRITDGMHINRPAVDLALRHLKNGRGVIFALPHMGDFEQAGLWINLSGAGTFTTVAERLKPESVFLKFLAFRESLGMEVLPTTGGRNPFGVMAQRLRAGGLVCLVADRDLSDTGVEVCFFGEKALMPAGPAALAVQTGAALMPATCWFVGEDEWGAHVDDEIPVPETGTRKEKVAAMTQAMAAVFERGIREHPENWHMLQKVFVADLDPERLRRSREKAAAAE